MDTACERMLMIRKAHRIRGAQILATYSKAKRLGLLDHQCRCLTHHMKSSVVGEQDQNTLAQGAANFVLDALHEPKKQRQQQAYPANDDDSLYDNPLLLDELRYVAATYVPLTCQNAATMGRAGNYKNEVTMEKSEEQHCHHHYNHNQKYQQQQFKAAIERDSGGECSAKQFQRKTKTATSSKGEPEFDYLNLMLEVDRMKYVNAQLRRKNQELERTLKENLKLMHQAGDVRFPPNEHSCFIDGVAPVRDGGAVPANDKAAPTRDGGATPVNDGGAAARVHRSTGTSCGNNDSNESNYSCSSTNATETSSPSCVPYSSLNAAPTTPWSASHACDSASLLSLSEVAQQQQQQQLLSATTAAAASSSSRLERRLHLSQNYVNLLVTENRNLREMLEKK